LSLDATHECTLHCSRLTLLARFCYGRSVDVLRRRGHGLHVCEVRSGWLHSLLCLLAAVDTTR
jgi:hypothetical protein